ncbi:pyridoxine/pyridoxal/pyridoxamine kinase [Bacillaceae bacterium W0354]
MKKVLTFAGSDTSGGAGIQADIKTFQETGVYGLTALTTIVAQDPTNHWNHNVYPIDVNTVKAQLKTILDGVGVDGMKTGMLPTVDVIELAAKVIDDYQLPAVIDPVLVCKGQDEALHPENSDALRELLVPKALVTTPNLFEAGQLAKMPKVSSIEEMKEAAATIVDLGAKNVVITGGFNLETNQVVDVFYDGDEFMLLQQEKNDTTYTHGAGCTFSSAVISQIVQGKTPKEAVKFAKTFITNAINGSWKLNEYVGPVNQYANR